MPPATPHHSATVHRDDPCPTPGDSSWGVAPDSVCGAAGDSTWGGVSDTGWNRRRR